MKIETLDHVALWVRDRDTLADFLTRPLGMHVISRTERFTLVGSEARRGKLTLFAAEGEREPGALVRVVLAVRDLEEALAELPPDLAVARVGRTALLTGPEGLGLGLVEAETEVDFDLHQVVFRVPEPARTFRELAELGFEQEDGRLRAGDAYVELEAGDPGESARPLLNHLGLRVESADEHIAEAESRGLEIADIVDAPNTYAVFVWGPDRIKLEYVEHKASFSLV
jgi:catechol 2,3-dioxygenase-like lactoylglutathione lyase family enzyme